MTELKIEDTDLYELLGIESNCTTADVKKAYRKKALECHPDKNPDNPNAANLFHQLSKVLGILTDESARKAYDKVLNGKKAAALRNRELDSKRRKLKEDLEYREQQAQHSKKSDDELLKEAIERLRKEGSKHLQEEMEYVNKLAREQKDSEKRNKAQEWDSSKYRIKIKWQATKNDEANGGYTPELLSQFLSKYGDINILVMSPKKTGSALVEFKTRRGAEMAVELEQGLSKNPLKLEWVNGPPGGAKISQSSLVKETDFESLVLHKMRQAEERKKLIEQMMAEDNA